MVNFIWNAVFFNAFQDEARIVTPAVDPAVVETCSNAGLERKSYCSVDDGHGFSGTLSLQSSWKDAVQDIFVPLKARLPRTHSGA